MIFHTFRSAYTTCMYSVTFVRLTTSLEESKESNSWCRTATYHGADKSRYTQSKITISKLDRARHHNQVTYTKFNK